MMSKKLFDSFDKETQEIFSKAAQEAAQHERNWNAAEMADQLKFLEEQGMEIIDKPDLEAFQDAVKPVYDEYGSKFGDLIERINSAK